DAAAEPFLVKRGYHVHDTCLIFQRQLMRPLNVVDTRFVGLRSQYDVVVSPLMGITSWWDECVRGPIELIEFRLEEKGTSKLAARVRAWEMEGFSWRWNLPAVGLVSFEVRQDLRGKGMGKFLLAQILRYLQDQFFGLVELHVTQNNEAGVRLCRGLGFDQVDVGKI